MLRFVYCCLSDNSAIISSRVKVQGYIPSLILRLLPLWKRREPSPFYRVCDVKGGQILIMQGWTKLAPTPVWVQAFSRQLTIFWDIFDFSVSSLSCDSRSCQCNYACTCCNHDHELWTTWAGFCVCPRTMCLPLTSHTWYNVPGSPPP